MVSSPPEAPDSINKPKPDVTAPTDRIVQQAQAGADNISATSPFRAGKDSTSTSTTDTQVRAASEQMSMGAGIGTAGKTESFQASDGSTIQGQTYTSKDGTFMKVPGGADGKGTTYQIEQGDNGQRSLSRIDSAGNKEPVQLRQQNDNRGAEAPPATSLSPTPERAPTPVVSTGDAASTPSPAPRGEQSFAPQGPGNGGYDHPGGYQGDRSGNPGNERNGYPGERTGNPGNEHSIPPEAAVNTPRQAPEVPVPTPLARPEPVGSAGHVEQSFTQGPRIEGTQPQHIEPNYGQQQPQQAQAYRPAVNAETGGGYHPDIPPPSPPAFTGQPGFAPPPPGAIGGGPRNEYGGPHNDYGGPHNDYGGPHNGDPGGPRGDFGMPGRPGDFQRMGADGGTSWTPGTTPGFRNPDAGASGELGGQPRFQNIDANFNARQSLDGTGTIAGLRQPGADAAGALGRTPTENFAPTDAAVRNGMPSGIAAGAEAAALNAASRAGADNAALIAAARVGADNSALIAAARPGMDALAKVAAPTDVLAPTASQNKMLQQAGFNANNPADAAFLASARAQLLAARLNDGTNTNATLATALSGANQTNLNKLAVLLTGKADATASNVVLNEANIARLNALFKPDAHAIQAGMAMPLDAKGLAARGLTDILASRQPSLTQMSQKDIYGELNKLGNQLMHGPEGGQRLAMADLISRNFRPNDLVAGAGLLANNLENLATRKTEAHLIPSPENALATANAIAAARARAMDVHGEVTPEKPAPHAPHNDLAEGLLAGKGLPIDGKGLHVDGKPGEKIADKIADSRIGPETRIGGAKPTAITSAEAILNTRAAADAARANATKNIEVEGGGGSDLTLAPRKDMADLGDKREPKKKPEGKGENQGFSIDGSLLTGAALRLFGDKKDEKADETNASNKVDETKSQRRKYLIKDGDTLDSIAREGFGDSKMAVLIAAVNSEVIAKETDAHTLLQAGMSIWLPSEIEVEEFLGNVSTQAVDAADQKLTPEEELARRFGNGWDGLKTPSADAAAAQPDLMSAATAVVAATAKRRENVEKLLGPLSEKKIDYIKYTVRLGDTLKSVATKHPALKDVSLWELVASVNEIAVPGNNASAVKLTRGSSLRLPTPAEIEEFRNANANKKPIGNGPISRPRTGGTTGARSIVIPPGNPLANTAIEKQDSKIVDEHSVTRASAPIRDAGASLLRAGGFVKDQSRTHDDATIVTTPLEKLPKPEISKPITTDKPSVENIKNLSEDCRIVRRHQVDATGRLYQAQLEVLRNGAWTSVMMYNISDGNCWRKSINELGVTEILQLDLPTAAIHQMLESDFTNNWEEYRDRVLGMANAH